MECCEQYIAVRSSLDHTYKHNISWLTEQYGYLKEGYKSEEETIPVKIENGKRKRQWLHN